MRLDSVLLSALLLSRRASAQFPPEPEGVTVLRSKFHENVTISFKEVSLVSHIIKHVPLAHPSTEGAIYSTGMKELKSQ